MPELPEVETVVRGLRRTIVGRTISRVSLDAPPSTIVVGPSFGRKKFETVLKNRTVNSIDRRGKNILIRLSGEATLWAHLKMTGHFFWKASAEPIEKHDLAIFDFAPVKKNVRGNIDNRYHLRFNDYRRFGRLRLFHDKELSDQKGLYSLGPEPLTIALEDFVLLFRRSGRMIKPALLDQSFIAGIGNIYADEALWAAKINPTRNTSSVSRAKLVSLHGHIQRILNYSIKNMGTSIDTYSGVDGERGAFQKYLKAYGNEGLPCGHCGNKIVREKIGSRSAHYCPRCQRRA